LARDLEVLSRLDDESPHRCRTGADVGVGVAAGGGVALWVQRDAVSIRNAAAPGVASRYDGAVVARRYVAAYRAARNGAGPATLDLRTSSS
jgi:hypothetical protein